MSSSGLSPAGILSPFSAEQELSKLPAAIITKRNIHFDECIWASVYPEVQQACYLSRICTLSSPKCCRFRNIPAILQEGPTCGLTAISMVLNGNPTLAEILELAKEKKYTNNGEMLCADNLCHLITDLVKKKELGIECQLHQGQLNCAKVKNYLIDSACMLVPYDPDYNHAPCLKKGHKAHWALIIGYLVDIDEQFYVISRHGKARNIAIWSLEDLSASNSNLIEFSQPKTYSNMDFVQPIGGIGGKYGLRDRSIIISNIKSEIITLV